MYFFPETNVSQKPKFCFVHVMKFDFCWCSHYRTTSHDRLACFLSIDQLEQQVFPRSQQSIPTSFVDRILDAFVVVSHMPRDNLLASGP